MSDSSNKPGLCERHQGTKGGIKYKSIKIHVICSCSDLSGVTYSFPSDHDTTFLFTSESVGEGHPGTTMQAIYLFNSIDKICDQVSDAILDACLKQDRLSKVAVETAVKTGMVSGNGRDIKHCHY